MNENGMPGEIVEEVAAAETAEAEQQNKVVEAVANDAATEDGVVVIAEDESGDDPTVVAPGEEAAVVVADEGDNSNTTTPADAEISELPDAQTSTLPNADETQLLETDASQHQTQEKLDTLLQKVQEAQVKLLDLEQKAEEILSQLQPIAETNDKEQLTQFAAQYAEIFTQFDQVVAEADTQIQIVAPNEINVAEYKSLSYAYDELFDIKLRIEALQASKDLLYLKTTPFSELMSSQSNQDATEQIDQLATDGEITPEEAEQLKSSLQKAQEKAGMTLDKFVEFNRNLHKGSSLDTFLAFLRNPVEVAGREGLQFGSVDLGEEFGKVESVPLPMFRELFTDSAWVGKVLKKTIELTSPEWAQSHDEIMRTIRDGNQTAAETKHALLEVFKTLLNDSDTEKQESNRKKFRVYFGSLLTKSDNNQKCLNGEAFGFFLEQMIDGGKKLDSLWNLSNTSA